MGNRCSGSKRATIMLHVESSFKYEELSNQLESAYIIVLHIVLPSNKSFGFAEIPASVTCAGSFAISFQARSATNTSNCKLQFKERTALMHMLLMDNLQSLVGLIMCGLTL